MCVWEGWGCYVRVFACLPCLSFLNTLHARILPPPLTSKFSLAPLKIFSFTPAAASRLGFPPTYSLLGYVSFLTPPLGPGGYFLLGSLHCNKTNIYMKNDLVIRKRIVYDLFFVGLIGKE